MKRVLYLLAACIAIPVLARIGEMKVEKKTANPKNTKEDIVCCEINFLNGANDIKINKVCLGKGKTIIEMEFTKNYSACTILASNILVDNSGKQYSPTYHSGLANCPELSMARRGHKFYWGFEPIDKKAKSLRMKEDETMHPGMIAMEWTEISIEHCKW
ncbi:MAG TPA: hypothetical protein PK079_12090 [Leptospiraceae bacterium]|nr:hypothetical protein [Leptospiraceae bacterium]HMX31817.1 hypothetical protein [Leptospiraceae bacterium]HMY32540.1 hypothetical protein [Leptospiraceae bacterium]HMZ67015.1 hypothetical protein [Leptospiraceae bacterium]HNA06881.1 hypothetical protein [Leptospiraceae bacterium]